MIEGEIAGRAAILAFELVAQEHVEPGEGWAARWPDIGLERDDGGKRHREAGRVHHALILGQDVHALEEHRLDRVLPGPQRQRKITQRTVIRVEDKRRAIVGYTLGG